MLELVGQTLAYAGVGLAILVVGFFVMDLLTPGKLGELVGAGNPNAGVLGATTLLALGLVMWFAIFFTGAGWDGLDDALVFGLVVLGWALRSWWPVGAAAVLLAAAFFFIRAYPDIAPETRYTAEELRFQREGGLKEPTSGDPFDPGEASFDSHLDSLREGIATVVTHPQGFGVGNAGVTAKRTGTEIKAGESTYTELGVELGLLGMLAFVAWNVAILRLILRRSPWVAATFASVLALALQTDVIGVHWLAFVLWALAGERA